MKNILILSFLLSSFQNIQAQNMSPVQTAFYLTKKDSIMPIYILSIFKTKNKKGEILEDFAKKELGEKYDEIFGKGKESFTMDNLEKWAGNNKIYRLILKIDKRFLKDKHYRQYFIRNWNNGHSILNEVVCTEKEYYDLLTSTLISNKYMFSMLMLPLISARFKLNLKI